MVSIVTLVAGALLGIVSTYVSAKQKFRDDLQTKFNESLHTSRVNAYQQLWSELQVLASYARPHPVTHELLRKLAEDLRKWYYEIGGIFLTDNSRDAYLGLQEAIVAELKKPLSDRAELDNGSFEAIRLRGSTLRTNLSADLRSRRQPQF